MKLITFVFTLFILVANAKGQDSLKYNDNDSLKITNQEFKKSDSWTGIDKGQHFAGSLIGTILLSQVNNRYYNIDKSHSKIIGAGVVISIGLTKELFDSKKDNNIFSWKDLLANVAGIIAGVAIMEIK